MKKKNTCVNNHESTVSENLGSTSPVQSSNPMPHAMAELGCTFTKITKKGKPVLLACLNIQAQPTATETLSALLHHAEELNLRLPFLRVSVRMNTESGSADITNTETASTGTASPETASPETASPKTASPTTKTTTESGVSPHYLFVLQGLSHHGITARNISNFLNRLTHDFKIFLAYAEAHNIQVQPNLENSAVKPFV